MSAWEIAKLYFELTENMAAALRCYCACNEVCYEDVIEEIDALKARERRRKKYDDEVD